MTGLSPPAQATAAGVLSELMRHSISEQDAIVAWVLRHRHDPGMWAGQDDLGRPIARG